jgi:nitrate reductase NapAB chaperone NapD
MSFAENYFTNHTFLMPQIIEPPSGLLSFIVVIPSYMEEHIIETLECLKKAQRPAGSVEVIIVFNYSEKKFG